MKIDFVSDVACPWCAVGLWSLDRALERHRRRGRGRAALRAVRAQPDDAARRRGHRPSTSRASTARSPEQLAQNRAVLRERGAAVGFAFGERPRIWNTFDAHRLLHWAGLEPARRSRALKHALLTRVPLARREPGRARRAAARRRRGRPRRRARRARSSIPTSSAPRCASASATGSERRHQLGAGGGHRRPAPDLGRPAARGLRARPARARRRRLSAARRPMLIVIAALLGVLGFAIGFSAFGALVRARLFRFVFGALLSLVLLVAGAVLALVALGIEGMQALTKEETGGADQGRAERPAALRRDRHLRRRPGRDLRPRRRRHLRRRPHRQVDAARQHARAAHLVPARPHRRPLPRRSSRRTRRGAPSIRSARRR